MKISQALGWLKTLKQRYGELASLRDENSRRSTRYLEAKEIKDEPVYDVKHLDKMIVVLAREVRKLDEAIKTTNATTDVADYTKDEEVLGELQ